MNRRLSASLALAALALAACETTSMAPPPYQGPPGAVFIATPYAPGDFAWSTQKGANGIRGSSPKGHSCANLSVGLTPDAPYSRERIVKLYGSAVRADRPVSEIRNKPVANDNPDLARFVRRARCDALGRFAFDALPDGAYFLIVQVAGPAEPLALMRHVVLRGGDIEPVPLTITAAR